MEQDGKRPADHTSNAIKYDNGKLRWGLMPMWALEPVVRVWEFGANKYGHYGYLDGEGMKWTKISDAAQRHLNSWVQGEELDPESCLPHLAHLIACAIMLMCYTMLSKYRVNDDRFKLPLTKHTNECKMTLPPQGKQHERQEGEKATQTGTGVGPQRNSPGYGAEQQW